MHLHFTSVINAFVGRTVDADPHHNNPYVSVAEHNSLSSSPSFVVRHPPSLWILLTVLQGRQSAEGCLHTFFFLIDRKIRIQRGHNLNRSRLRGWTPGLLDSERGEAMGTLFFLKVSFSELFYVSFSVILH